MKNFLIIFLLLLCSCVFAHSPRFGTGDAYTVDEVDDLLAAINYAFVTGNDVLTDILAAELETLTDTSSADSLHGHDHGVLAGLSDDADHTQYLLGDGTRPLTGNWDVGGFNITGIGTVEAAIYEDSSLLGWWQFNNNSAKDSSRNGNDGTFVNQANASNDVLELDGVNDYVSIPGVSNSFSGDFSVSMWFNANNVSSGADLFSASYVNDSDERFRLGFFGGGFTSIISDRTPNTLQIIGTPAVTAGKWFHILATVDQTNQIATLYVNMNIVGTDTNFSAGGSELVDNIRIGIRVNLLNDFDGLISDVRVHDRVLSAYEVQRIYEEGNKRFIYADEFIGNNYTGLGEINNDGEITANLRGLLDTGLTLNGSGTGGNARGGRIRFHFEDVLLPSWVYLNGNSQLVFDNAAQSNPGDIGNAYINTVTGSFYAAGDSGFGAEAIAGTRLRVFEPTDVAILLVETDGDVSAQLRLDSVRTGEGNLAGQIKFLHAGSEVARIAGRQGSGTAAMDLTFSTKPEAGSLTERMRIDEDGVITLGDGTNEVITSSTGDLVFAGTAGLVYGGISAVENAVETTIASSGVKVQVTIFDRNMPSNNATSDHTNDHITITKVGNYQIIVSATVNSIGGASSVLELEVMKNNGASRLGHLHADRSLGGGGTERGSISLSDIVALEVNDTVELWIENETNTQNYIIDDVTLSLFQLGGG